MQKANGLQQHKLHSCSSVCGRSGSLCRNLVPEIRYGNDVSWINKNQKNGAGKIGQYHCISKSAKKIKASLSPLSHYHPLCLANQSQMYVHEAFIQPPPPPLSPRLLQVSHCLCFCFSVWASSSGSLPLCLPPHLFALPHPRLTGKAGNTPGSWPWREHVSSNHLQMEGWRMEVERHESEVMAAGKMSVTGGQIRWWRASNVAEGRGGGSLWSWAVHMNPISSNFLFSSPLPSLPLLYFNELRQLEPNPVIKQLNPLKSPCTVALCARLETHTHKHTHGFSHTHLHVSVDPLLAPVIQYVCVWCSKWAQLL